jgi:UDP-N-acetyl-2-amino-2-deoxyglucuronate dehydrogenase
MDAGALVVVGCGWIAQRHATAARRLGLPLIFASRDLERARRYARTFHGIAAYGSYEEALADARAVAAVICTPHDRHASDTRAAFAAGKHVLIEKPLARTLEEADEIIAAARDAGRVLMTAEQFHFMPAFRRLKALLDTGRFGALREIHLIARGFGARTGWRLSAATVGGGALIDGGIHYVHNLRWWGGDVHRVVAMRPTQTVTAMEGEDAITLLAELAGGGVGLLTNSLGAPGVPRMQWATVTGTRGSGFVENRGRWLIARADGRTRLSLFRRDVRGYEAMLRAFRDAIGRGHAVEMDGAEGRADLAVVLAAYRSVAERGPVVVDTVADRDARS